MKFMSQHLLKISLLFIVLMGGTHLNLFGEILNPAEVEAPVARKLVFQNSSILKCGPQNNSTVFTLVDVKALLVIYNQLSKKNIPLTTQWNNMDNPKINLNKISETIPQDILYVLLLCLNWVDASTANLHTTSENELKKYLTDVREKKPWSVYPYDMQKKIESLSNEDLLKLIDIVMRAENAEKIYKNLLANPALKSVSFMWLL